MCDSLKAQKKVSKVSKTANDGDSSGNDTDFEEIENLYQAQTRNGINAAYLFEIQ